MLLQADAYESQHCDLDLTEFFTSTQGTHALETMVGKGSEGQRETGTTPFLISLWFVLFFSCCHAFPFHPLFHPYPHACFKPHPCLWFGRRAHQDRNRAKLGRCTDQRASGANTAEAKAKAKANTAAAARASTAGAEPEEGKAHIRSSKSAKRQGLAPLG